MFYRGRAGARLCIHRVFFVFFTSFACICIMSPSVDIPIPTGVGGFPQKGACVLCTFVSCIFCHLSVIVLSCSVIVLSLFPLQSTTQLHIPLFPLPRSSFFLHWIFTGILPRFPLSVIASRILHPSSPKSNHYSAPARRGLWDWVRESESREKYVKANESSGPILFGFWTESGGFPAPLFEIRYTST